MSYKANFRPVERLSEGRWERMGEPSGVE
jgi:arginyl-tRNA--protein-N-Asp/Glu arginylyltransferase